MITKLDNVSSREAAKKNFRSPKARVFLLLTILSYGLIFYTLFEQFLLFRSMIFVMLFFLFFHFFFLDIRKLPVKYLFFVVLGVTLIQIFFVGFGNIRLLLSLLALNAGIVYFAWILQGEGAERIYFSAQGYFNTGGYMFTVFITIAYSLFVVGYYQKFPFTCEVLSEASNSVVDFVTEPFKIGIEEAKIIKTNTTNFFSTKFGDIVDIGENIIIQTPEASTTPSILEKIRLYKKQLIDQTIADNSKVNMGICDYVLGEINKIYNTPGVKVSVITLMFLLLYGFIRIEFWVMTGLGYIVFKILYRLKIYRTKKVLKEVEELE